MFQPEDFRLLGALRQRAAFADMWKSPWRQIRARSNAPVRRIPRSRDQASYSVVQSFGRHALERLGRIHSADDTRRAVAELRAAKLDNFNLDLMYALPGQSLEEALDDVRIACQLGPAHISYYQLTLEPGTVFHARPPQLPDEDVAWQMQTAGQKLLDEAGFDQYEVSAYARPGKRCRHNMNYWLFGDYLGLGAGAHGKLSFALPQRILRTTKPKQPREYQEQMQTRTQGVAGEPGGPIGRARSLRPRTCRSNSC